MYGWCPLASGQEIAEALIDRPEIALIESALIEKDHR